MLDGFERGKLLFHDPIERCLRHALFSDRLKCALEGRQQFKERNALIGCGFEGQ